MASRNWIYSVILGVVITGCTTSDPANPPATGTSETPSTPTKATAKSEDVQAAQKRLAAIPRATFAPKEGSLLTEIVIADCSSLTSEDVALFGRLTDLEKLHLVNFRNLNDEMAAQLKSLKGLKSLALTNSVINNGTVELIVNSFPNLVELDLSSNTNMTNKVVSIITGLKNLQRLSLVQNQVNDIGAGQFKNLQELRSLDLRGNMEAGDMALEVVAALPKLTGFKHRSTAVSDSGMEYLSANTNLDSLLIQDFNITDQSGPHLAKLSKLTQLEVFRCQGFGSEGVKALKGMGLTRFTLRDLPNVYDQALEVFDDLPQLKRLFLHELPSVGDEGLSHLANLKTLEQLDIWNVPQMTDATLDVIAGLPNLKTLSLRTTGITDAGIEKILGMQSVQSLTFKENGMVTEEGLKKLSSRKWKSLDVGKSGSGDEAQ